MSLNIQHQEEINYVQNEDNFITLYFYSVQKETPPRRGSQNLKIQAIQRTQVMDGFSLEPRSYYKS